MHCERGAGSAQCWCVWGLMVCREVVPQIGSRRSRGFRIQGPWAPKGLGLTARVVLRWSCVWIPTRSCAPDHGLVAQCEGLLVIPLHAGQDVKPRRDSFMGAVTQCLRRRRARGHSLKSAMPCAVAAGVV